VTRATFFAETEGYRQRRWLMRRNLTVLKLI